MADTVMHTLKKFFWYGMANSVREDARNAILNDEAFFRNVKDGRNATIHLSKKHLRVVVAKVVNDMLIAQQYAVISMKYRFHGMDVFVSHQ